MLTFAHHVFMTFSFSHWILFIFHEHRIAITRDIRGQNPHHDLLIHSFRVRDLSSQPSRRNKLYIWCIKYTIYIYSRYTTVKMEGVLNRLCKLLCNALLWGCFFYCCWWWWIKIRVNTLCCKLGPQASKHIMDKERKAHPQRESKKHKNSTFQRQASL